MLKNPTLSKMARDILLIQVSAVAVDYVFDMEPREMDEYKSSLRPETVETLICAKEWLLDSDASSSSNAIIKTEAGYNIGIRLIDEFLAKSGVSRCVDFKETAEMIAKVGFKMFLGVTASVPSWDADGTCCSIVLEDNPLVDFMELPDTCQGLYYCNVLTGVIRGALEMVSMKTEVTWTRDVLQGDDAYELLVKLLKQVAEEYLYKDDE